MTMNDPSKPPVPTCFNCKTDPVAIGDLCKACIRRIEVVFEDTPIRKPYGIKCPECPGDNCPDCKGYGYL